MKKYAATTGTAEKSLIKGLTVIMLTVAGSIHAQKPTSPPPSYDLEGGYIFNMGKVSPIDGETGFTNTSLRHMSISVGQLSGVDPQTGQYITNKYELVSFVTRQLDVTGTAYFYTNLYIAGNIEAYGTISGDGTGITNISTSSLIGLITDRPELQEALAEKLDSEAAWTAINANAADITALEARVEELETSPTSDRTDSANFKDAIEANTADITVLYEEMVSVWDAVDYNADINAVQQDSISQLQHSHSNDVAELRASVSNAVSRLYAEGYVSTNETGDLSISGSILASNVTALSFIGDGSGLTNLSISSIAGTIVEQPELLTALAGKLDTNGVWNAIKENASAVAELIAESADTNNPHQVTAEQIEALPITGGSMTGHIDMDMSHRLLNLPEPANDDEAVTKSYLDKRLNYIIPQGDLAMGIYTNFPGY